MENCTAITSGRLKIIGHTFCIQTCRLTDDGRIIRPKYAVVNTRKNNIRWIIFLRSSVADNLWGISILLPSQCQHISSLWRSIQNAKFNLRGNVSINATVRRFGITIGVFNKKYMCAYSVCVCLWLYLRIFISVFNQLDAQNLFHNKFYFIPLHVSSTFTHHQEVKIVLHSLWYHQTCINTPVGVMIQILCIKLVKYWDKNTEMHGQ